MKDQQNESKSEGVEEIDLSEEEESALERAWSKLESENNPTETPPQARPTHPPTSEDDLDERSGLIAEILEAIYGEDALAMFDEIFGKDDAELSFDTTVGKGKWNAIDHPRGKGGRFIPRGSAEAVSGAKDLVKFELSGKHTPEGAKKLTEHLSILTVKQLRELAKEYDLQASGKDREALKAKIAERLNKGRRNEEEKPTEPEGKKSEKSASSAVDKPADSSTIGDRGETGSTAPKKDEGRKMEVPHGLEVYTTKKITKELPGNDVRDFRTEGGTKAVRLTNERKAEVASLVVASGEMKEDEHGANWVDQIKKKGTALAGGWYWSRRFSDEIQYTRVLSPEGKVYLDVRAASDPNPLQSAWKKELDKLATT